MLRAIPLFALWLAGAASAAPLADPIPAPIPSGSLVIELVRVADGFELPLQLSHAGDGSGRLFVMEQSGRIHVLRGGVRITPPFLDLADVVDRGFEKGLLGLAFHPGFADPESPGRGALYTYTSEPVSVVLPADFSSPDPSPQVPDHQSVVAEWRVDSADPDRVDPASRRELLRIDQPQHNHNAGALVFGHDGLLYIALGDGGGSYDRAAGHGPGGSGQDTQTVLGAILRIDPDARDAANGAYGIPPGNPFVAGGGLAEIFAYGFRNPYRMSVDRETGEIVVGDVGQGEIEEVDRVVAGGNYGWRHMEGSFASLAPGGSGGPGVTDDLTGVPPGLIDPVAEYDHDEGLSVIGGHVYRGGRIPGLVGRYVFGDWFQPGVGGRLFHVDLAVGGIEEFRIGDDDRALGLTLLGFGEDAEGELHVLGTGPESGVVYRIVPEPGAGAVLALAVLGALRLTTRPRAAHRRGSGAAPA